MNSQEEHSQYTQNRCLVYWGGTDGRCQINADSVCVETQTLGPLQGGLEISFQIDFMKTIRMNVPSGKYGFPTGCLKVVIMRAPASSKQGAQNTQFGTILCSSLILLTLFRI